MSQEDSDLSMRRAAIRDAVREVVRRTREAKRKGNILRLEVQGLEVTSSLYPMYSLLGTSTTLPGRPLTDFVEIVQGVTWGGKGAEQVFDLDERDVKKLDLEKEVTPRRIGGRDIEQWRVNWMGRHVLFPYLSRKGKWSRAFGVVGEVTKPVAITDALDFEHPVDETEKSILGRDSSKDEKHREILEHRIANGLVKFPNAATYLVQHFDQLAARTFEDRTLREYNKKWYEYHRPRTPTVTRRPKIVGPRLVKTARFALDNIGFLPRDSVIVMAPKQRGFDELKKALTETLSTECSDADVLRYILAFLNSATFNNLLEEKISKKRGGYPIIDERLLRRVAIPVPTGARKVIVKKLLGLVKDATSRPPCNEIDEKIDSLSETLYQSESRSRLRG